MSTLKARYANSHPFVKVLQWMGAVVLLTIFALSVLSLLQKRCGWDSADINLLKAIQALQTVCVFVLPPLVVAYLWTEQPVRWLHMQKNSCPVTLWFLVPLSILIAAPGINLLAHLNQQLTLPAFLQPIEDIMREMEQKAEYLTGRFLQVSTIGGLLLNMFIMAFLPAMGEEMTFRGLLLNALTSRHTTHRATLHLAVWGVAILFSAVHLQFYGFIPRMLLGAYLGYLLIWTGSMWLPILAHFTNNVFAVLAYFVAFRCQTDTALLESIGTGDTLWIGIASLVLSLFLILYIRKISTTERQSA
ncbi:MAG: CPBP family intramembrane metalloprotease [Paludibacteraceae bacterium]|nr:CPBP family intramembrane metalloprotease [Paludibacteraceae bacterium]